MKKNNCVAQMLKNILKILSIFILGVLGGIFANQFLMPYLIKVPFFSNFYNYIEPAPIYINKTEKIIIQENIALRNAIEKVEKSVIGVKTTTKKGKSLEGSGLILTSDGLAITLAELAPKDGNTALYFEGKKLNYKIIKRDLEENLALIKIDGNNLPTAGFGNLDKLKLGERVFLVGAMFEGSGVEDIKKIANEGIIKYIENNSIQTNVFEKRAQGSALFDIEGNFLGLNQTAQHVGEEITTIPVSKVKQFANL